MRKFTRLLKYLSIALVVIIILVTRFYHLGTQPPGLHIDEVSFAAEAKAIAETGRDTWNQPWPLVFKAFGEWKAPGLVYTMAFWYIVLSHMDNLVTHLPSAIAGITSLLMFYLTLKEIWGKNHQWSLIIAVFILSFSPWHFDMSRIFYEAFSAMAIFSISILFITKATLSKTINIKQWILAAIFAGLTGYWYASIRYIAIFTIILAVAVQPWQLSTKLKKGALLLFILLLTGLGWVGDLYSDKGLNRLEYYNNKSAEGAALVINEKRQFCYLSFDRDKSKSQYCYWLWNKPVEKLTNAVRTYYRYLGTDFLFLESKSEYGIDVSYGAFLYPIIPFYLAGLFSMGYAIKRFLESIFRNKRSKINKKEVLYSLYALIILVSLVPTALTGSTNMRMGLIALYIIAIVIGIGIIEVVSWCRRYLGRLTTPLYLGYGVVLLFFIIQSLSHYFLVFTHSNDIMWTSDSSQIFNYIKSVSDDYDYVIDTELHGPLAPYFYGDITTKEIQEEGVHSLPDNFGFSHLTKAGKYEVRSANIKELACEKHQNLDKRKILTISTPVNDLISIRKFAGESWTKALLLHEVYDLDDIIRHELVNDPSFAKRCSPQ